MNHLETLTFAELRMLESDARAYGGGVLIAAIREERKRRLGSFA